MLLLKKILSASLLLMILAVATSCMTYTYADARQVIPAERSIPETPFLTTKAAQPAEAVGEQPLSGMATTPQPRPTTLVDTFTAALVPLPCQASPGFLDRIVEEAITANMDILGFTGEVSSIAHVASKFPSNSTLLDSTRLRVTDLKVLYAESPFVVASLDSGKTLAIALMDIQDSNVFQSLLTESTEEAWTDTILEAHETRKAHMEPLVQFTGNHPLLVLASLGEPSGDDWFETAEGHPYRIPFAWPMADLLDEQGYMDSWRLTHYDAETAPGTTWELTTTGSRFSERVDFLLVKGLLPSETHTVPIGPWETKRLPHEQRSAVTGTFIVP